MSRADWTGANNPRVGYLHVGRNAGPGHAVDELQTHFDNAMLALGYDGGPGPNQNTNITYRYADWDKTTLVNYADELLSNNDVVVAADSLSLEALMLARDAQSGRPTPVVKAICGALAEPWHSGKAHGLTNHAKHDIRHRLRLLLRIDPNINNIAILHDPNDQSSLWQMLEATKIISNLGHNPYPYPVSLQLDPPAGAATAAVQAALGGAGANPPCDGMIVMADPLVSRLRFEIITEVNNFCKPVIYPHLDFVQAGGLISYGPDRYALMDQAADYVDDFLVGSGDKPDRDPVRKYLALNLISCPNINVPNPIVQQADYVYTPQNPPPPPLRLKQDERTQQAVAPESGWLLT